VMKTIGRRELLVRTGKVAAGFGFALPFAGKLFGAEAQTATQSLSGRKLKIMVTGGHPGDPECGCGGTIARYTDLGHDVVLMYLNRGQAYCGDASVKDCGAVRTAEAEKACGILKARAAFAGQYDGKAIVDAAHYDEIRKMFDAEKPDVLLAQWPIDRHRDHRALSNLVLDAWMESGKKSAFHYYGIAEDTMMFTAMEFVDITAVEARKRAACFAHASQQPEKWYPLEEKLTRFRGTESGYAQAEGFAKHWESKGGLLP
jgi:LmbE family N-acetylglucosaminyl deacetylase